MNKLDIFIKTMRNTGMRAIVQGFNKTLENYLLPKDIISIGSVPYNWLEVQY